MVDQTITTTSYPFQYSDGLSYDASTFNAVLLIGQISEVAFYAKCVLGIGVSIIPGGFAIDVVKDRARHTKHQLFVSGGYLRISLLIGPQVFRVRSTGSRTSFFQVFFLPCLALLPWFWPSSWM